MKYRVVNYTFDASLKKVTFTDITTIKLESILLIVNTTDQEIIFNFADSAKGGTVATNVLTLEHDTTSMSDTDDLLIYYDDDQEGDRVSSSYTLLTGIDQVYDSTPSTATSAAVDCSLYRWASLMFELTSSGSPTDFTFEVQVTPDGTNWFKLTNGSLGNMIYSDASAATTIQESYSFPICAKQIRVKVTGTGLGASNTFTLDDTTLYLRS